MHLDRLITILEAVAVSSRPISATEIHRLTGYPKPTCYRLIQDLRDHLLLDPSPEKGRFVLGERFKRIALMGQTDSDVRLAAAPLIKEAAIDMGAAFFLSRFRNNGVEIIHVELPNDGAVSYVHPGLGFRPMHACSCSKVIAAFSDDAFQKEIIKGPKKAYTDCTMTSASALRSEFESIRKRGFAECVEEIEVGVSSVAAPVILDETTVPFSLGAIGSIRRFTKKSRTEFGKLLISLSDQLASKLQVDYLNAPEGLGLQGSK